MLGTSRVTVEKSSFFLTFLFVLYTPCADGVFPINLSKFQVEKDHTFLEQADLDSLIRRLNILNRCADVMETLRKRVSVSQVDKLRRVS